MSFTQSTLWSAGIAGLVLGFAAHAADRAPATSPGLKADVVVNGRPISHNHVLLMSSGLNPDKKSRSANDAESQSAARAELITQELLAQEARKQGFEKRPAVADQLSFQEREVLSRAYLEDFFEKNPVTDASLQKTYEWNRANGKIVEYKVRHVLVSTPEQAQELIQKLAKGEDFTSLAKRYTQDPGGQNNGGDLGWFRPDIFVDHHFTDAIASLKKGQYTRAPVRTRFGWHVIKVEDGPRQVANPGSFESLDDGSKQALRQKTAQLKIEQLTSRLSAAAKITGLVAGAYTTTASR